MMPLGGRRLIAAFTALTLVQAMSSMVTTSVATASPTIVADLGRISLLPWLATAYLLAQIATIPLYGKLGDTYGRKWMLLLAVGVFLVASVLCGLAQTMSQLVAFRALQGVGAGGLAGLSMALVADISPPAKLGRFLGYTGLVYILTFVLGPLTGGLFVDLLSWRWAFLVNLPLGVAGGAVIVWLVPAPPRRGRAAVDYFGALLLAIVTTNVVLVLSWGGVEYGWRSAVILGLVLLAAASAGAFLAWEQRVAAPLLPLGVLRERAVALATASNLLATSGFSAGIVFLPVLFQAVGGVDATEAGVLLIPIGLGTALMTVAAGRITDRTGGAKALPAAGMVLMSVSFAVLGSVDPGTSVWFASAVGFCVGIGLGSVLQTMLLVVQRSVPQHHVGIATSTTMLGRLSGSALGVALFGGVFNRTLSDGLDGVAGVDLGTVRGDPQTIAALTEEVRVPVVAAFADALAAGFRVMVVVSVLGLVSVLLQRADVLRRRLTVVRDPAAVPAAVPQ